MINIVLFFILFYFALMIIVPAVLFFFLIKYVQKQNQKIRDEIGQLSNDAVEITPSDFFNLRRQANSYRTFKSDPTYNFSGVYILFNKTKNMYYVGQAKHVFDRVNQHFTGKGNGDVYADYKYGDEFTIKMINFENSGYSSLNELERNTIWVYDAYSKGYNKTRGNR